MNAHVSLTKIQQNKIKNKEDTIRLKADQLNGPDEIVLSIRNNNKLQKARAKNTGVQIKAKSVSNGDGMYLHGERPRVNRAKKQQPLIVIKKKNLPMEVEKEMSTD